MAFDKRKLFKPRLAEDTVEVPGMGTMRVRALSRAEVIDELNKVDRTVPGAFECRLVAMSLVDPVLTEDEVRKWREASEVDEVGTVIDKLNEISALTRQAQKDAYQELEASPDAEFRDVPGGEAGDDGRPAP